jgi:hypothetical protein
MTRHHHGSDASSRSAGRGFDGDDERIRKLALVYPLATGHAIVHPLVALHRRFETSEEAQSVWTTRGWELPPGADHRTGAAI